MNFRITGLPAENFTHLFALSDEELAAQGAVRRIADGRTPGYPCRVSLTDTREGDEMILVNYEHHGVDTPYRMRFAIYVRPGETRYDAVDEVPAQLRSRMLAVRSFGADAMMLEPSWCTDAISSLQSGGCLRTPGRPTCTSTSLRPAAMPRAWNGREPMEASLKLP